MIYDRQTVIEALGDLPCSVKIDGVTEVFEVNKNGTKLRVTFAIYDNEALVEWFIFNNGCDVRLKLQEIRRIRAVEDPQSKFLEIFSDSTTVHIWFMPEPRVYVLSPSY